MKKYLCSQCGKYRINSILVVTEKKFISLVRGSRLIEKEKSKKYLCVKCYETYKSQQTRHEAMKEGK